MSLRHRRETGDVPPVVAAHHMGCTSLAEFEQLLHHGHGDKPSLLARGFPPADETTGKFDLDAIKAWRRRRHPQLFPAERLPGPGSALNAGDVDVGGRLAAMATGRHR
jgi:hypothetical protein